MPDKNVDKSESHETCKYCEKEFTVTRWGWGIPCPHCCQLLNILPDPKIFLYIKGMPIGVAIVEDEKGIALGIFSQLATKFLRISKIL